MIYYIGIYQVRINIWIKPPQNWTLSNEILEYPLQVSLTTKMPIYFILNISCNKNNKYLNINPLENQILSSGFNNLVNLESS